MVWASSETVLGLPFETPPPYAPVDEEYPPRPESTYSMGKVLEEELARQIARWRPDATFVGLRFSNVMDVADYAGFEAFQDDPSLRRWNLWGYIDARDGAQAVRRALTADVPAGEVFVVANADTVMRTLVGGAHGRGVPGRRGARRPRRARDAAVDRQGPAPARLRAAALLARPRLSRPADDG